MALLFVLLEFFVPQQFPVHLGHSWINLSPYLGTAPYLGVPGFSFFSFWLAISMAKYFRTKKVDYWGLLFFLGFLTFNFTYPLHFPPDSETKSAKSTPRSSNIRLVQGNIGNFLKLDSERGGQTSKDVVLKTYFRLSTSTLPYPDLIVWPETSLPLLLNTDLIKKSPSSIPLIIRHTMHKTNAELFMGGYVKKKNNDDEQNLQSHQFFETEYNAALLFGWNDREEVTLKDHYYKIKLIPFGETLPFSFLNKFFSKFVDNISYFSKGDRFTLFKTKNGTHFISAICYEILFSQFIREYLNEVDSPVHFIINLTNDSWYGDTSEPYQHLFLAKWRAIEFQIPIVRMTNTGITSAIYPDGSESKRTSLYKEEILDLKLPVHTQNNRNKTFYQKFGIWNLLFLTLVLTGIMVLFSSSSKPFF